MNKLMNRTLHDEKCVIVALDGFSPREALECADKLDSGLCRLKVGKELHTKGGPDIVEELHEMGFEIFLDLKFHDIPDTVANAVRAVADQGVWMVNLHALGGAEMMEKAVVALQEYGEDRPLLTAVTVLTSLSDQDLGRIGMSGGRYQNVMNLASLAVECGVDGLISSGREVHGLRKKHKIRDKVLVTPGIRFEGEASHDQKAVTTPHDAIVAGSDYVVMGRSVTQARGQTPVEALKLAHEDILR